MCIYSIVWKRNKLCKTIWKRTKREEAWFFFENSRKKICRSPFVVLLLFYWYWFHYVNYIIKCNKTFSIYLNFTIFSAPFNRYFFFSLFFLLFYRRQKQKSGSSVFLTSVLNVFLHKENPRSKFKIKLCCFTFFVRLISFLRIFKFQFQWNAMTHGLLIYFPLIREKKKTITVIINLKPCLELLFPFTFSCNL